MKRNMRILVLLLALLMVGTVLAGCKGDDGKTPGGSLIGDDTDDNSGENPYAGVDFGGREFKIHINVNDAGFESSSKYIVPVEELDAKSDEVQQKVFERDAWMTANLNMGIEYTSYNAPYASVVESLRTIASAGAGFDLFIDKLFPMANFSLEGAFANVAGRPELQYFETYWYNDYMNSLSLDEGSTMYLLAGDYFIDVLRSANTMFVNLDMLDSFFNAEGGSEQFLNDVIDGKWTYEELMKRSETVYLAGDSVLSTRYGLLLHTFWEPMIPMVIAGGATFAEISDGEIISKMNDDRNVRLFESLKTLIHSDTCNTCTQSGTDGDWGLNPDFGVDATLSNIQTLFINGHGLFTYGRVASMETLSKAKLKFSVLPYPKNNESDPYITASHDTTEVGAIPRDAENVSQVLQMLEIMSELSGKNMLAVYYEKSLKLRYSSNLQVAAVVDIIHDNLGSAFALAYNNACSDLFLWNTFYTPLRDGRDYLSNLSGYSSALKTALSDLLKKWNEVS